MKAALKLLANPFLVAALSFLLALPLISRDLGPGEYVSAIPFAFVIFSLPFVLISKFTQVQQAQPDKQVRLVGLWVGAVVAALAWVVYVLSIDDAQAALGFLYTGLISVIGGTIGYLVFWFLNGLLHKSKKP